MVARRKNARNKKKQKSQPWGVILLSFAVGAFVMFLFHLKDNVPADQSEEMSTEAEVIVDKKIEPTFDFYTILPEVEVLVKPPKQETVVTLSAPVLTPKPTAEIKNNNSDDDSSYLLQVGSFRSAPDADSFKARLALLGIESKVQTVTIDNKETWHRVQVGPILGREKANALQSQLEQNEIKSLLMRAKRG